MWMTLRFRLAALDVWMYWEWRIHAWRGYLRSRT